MLKCPTSVFLYALELELELGTARFKSIFLPPLKPPRPTSLSLYLKNLNRA
jgi:hypothetical protein